MNTLTMTSLVERLSASDIGIETGHVNALRACLAALSAQLQGQGDADEELATQRSLQAWWQWFDDEGYDRSAMSQALRQLLTSRIGSQGFQDLLHHCQTIADDPEGLPILLAHLSDTKPELLTEFEQLTLQALEEEHQLMGVAGGKGGKAAVYTLLGTTGVLAFGAMALNIRKYRKEGQLYEVLLAKERHAAAEAHQHAHEAKILAEERVGRMIGHQAEPVFKEIAPKLLSMNKEQRRSWFQANRSTINQEKLLHEFEKKRNRALL